MSWEPVSSCFSVYLVLKPQSITNFNYNIYHFSSEESVWNAYRYNKNNWPETFMLSSTASEKHPEFAESLTAISYMDFDEVKEWENSIHTITNKQERGVHYDKFKQEKAEKMIEALEKKIPNIRDSIKNVYTSSPLSYRDYIGSFEGNMYGYTKVQKSFKNNGFSTYKDQQSFSYRSVGKYAWNFGLYHRSFQHLCRNFGKRIN